MSDTKVNLRSFESKILFFNGMYKLPIAPYPTLVHVITDEKRKWLAKSEESKSNKELLAKRLLDFRKTLENEINEVDDILSNMNRGFRDDASEYSPADMLTDIADWLTDIQVYCASEMAKYGLPIAECQNVVMGSNFSKLGADGNPIYDDAGKVLKGPGYWKPEPQLKALIEERISESSTQGNPNDIVWTER